MSRLRWKLAPRETGLRAVMAGHRASWLTDGVKRYACVRAFAPGHHQYGGWYWVAGWDSGVPNHNSCDSPSATAEEAKAAAVAYVKAHMGSRP